MLAFGFGNGATSKIDDVLTEHVELIHDFSVSPSPLGTNWVFQLGWIGLGLDLGVLGTKALGTGLDN